ncbi:hypothetical protein NUU61_005650 [Penicillium alfredii]|uniref:Uncharacterized protein n=1 Tax=Penicillium alfredii TaxID=1506179 RepID=A0A9W9F9Y6_9EURO|nr:uncharacterized protein NUU61_005650 [Penicillium alfredii]KAJ5096294.1 hypothetical protein NUU61_005650 [Penicillium alfredii]
MATRTPAQSIPETGLKPVSAVSSAAPAFPTQDDSTTRVESNHGLVVTNQQTPVFGCPSNFTSVLVSRTLGSTGWRENNNSSSGLLDSREDCIAGVPLTSFPAPRDASSDLKSLPNTAQSGFAQVALGKPLSKLEPDQIFNFQALSAPRPSPDRVDQNPENYPEPSSLGSLVVGQLTASQVLFYFGVLSIMARLNPQYHFKYGGRDGRNIGARLTLYGHTILVQPTAETVLEAKVAACRGALEGLREFNPQWLVAPQPMDRPTSPDWNWVQMLYVVNDGLFRTARGCINLSEGRNTVAHMTLYQLLVGQIGPNVSILPPDPSSSPMEEGELRPHKGEQYGMIQGSGLGHQEDGTLDQPVCSAKAKTSNPLPKQLPIRSRRGRKASSKAQYFAPNGNANLIPLANSRLASIKEPVQKKEGPLEMLKAIQKALTQMPRQASYMRVLEKICDVLNANCPTIRREKNISDTSGNSYVVLARFDNRNPYLNRASPIWLAEVSNPDPDLAHGIGVKKLILWLLKMVKEDSGVTKKAYNRELAFLKKLEAEVENRLRR